MREKGPGLSPRLRQKVGSRGETGEGAERRDHRARWVSRRRPAAPEGGQRSPQRAAEADRRVAPPAAAASALCLKSFLHPSPTNVNFPLIFYKKKQMMIDIFPRD